MSNGEVTQVVLEVGGTTFKCPPVHKALHCNADITVQPDTTKTVCWSCGLLIDIVRKAE